MLYSMETVARTQTAFRITNDKAFLAREVPRPMQVMTPQDFVNRCRA